MNKSARLVAIIGLMLMNCRASPQESSVKWQVRRADSLPSVNLGWVRMTDHFVATVGPASGQGEPLGNLLVLADATFAPSARFPLHAHQSMDIVSFVVSGTLIHHEPGKAERLEQGGIQHMSAGTGITHAEGNGDSTPMRMLQVWVAPAHELGAPRYTLFPPPSPRSGFGPLLPSGTVPNASFSLASLTAREAVTLHVAANELVYLVALDGELQVAAERLRDGDGLMVNGCGTLVITAATPARLFEVRQRVR